MHTFNMKDNDDLPVSTPTSSSVISSPSGISQKDHSSLISAFFRRRRYKFWALAAILFLAFWSMLTGTVTLRRSAEDLNRAGEYYTSAAANLDALDLEEREKLVEHMWDVYTNSDSPRIGLGGFWQEAFVAAYEDLMSELPEVRLAAVSEIARMSARYVLPHDSSSSWSKVDLNINGALTGQ